MNVFNTVYPVHCNNIYWRKDLRLSIREMGWGEVKLEDVNWEAEQLSTEGDVEKLCMERSESILGAGNE